MTAIYALMLPTILLVPKGLISTADGTANPAMELAMFAEIGDVVAT